MHHVGSNLAVPNRRFHSAPGIPLRGRGHGRGLHFMDCGVFRLTLNRFEPAITNIPRHLMALG